MPMTAKMKMMIQRTKVRFPRAPMVFPIMEMRRLSVGQDLANLNTLSWGRVLLMVFMMLMMVMLTTTMTLSWISFGLLAS